ncbi:MAG: DUF3106 domain-containing protein [Telluria sp.]
MIKLKPTLCVFALLLSFGGVAMARQAAPAVKAAAAVTVDKPVWKELSRPQQVALEPLQDEWDAMEGVRKQKWLEIANRYASMKPDEQARVHERMRAWLKLTPEERRLARENYTLSKKLDKGQKSAKWEQYQQLPEEEKRKLAADAAVKKSVTNLPPKSQPQAVTPVKPLPAPATNVPPVTQPAPAAPLVPVPVPNAK